MFFKGHDLGTHRLDMIVDGKLAFTASARKKSHRPFNPKHPNEPSE
jgi:hypothetical protein